MTLKQYNGRSNYSCISFFDLLGTKAAARNGIEKYEKLIGDFKNSIDISTSHFSDNDRIWIYSDNAYVKTASVETMLLFYEKLRLQLIPKGIFFTAAIDIGDMKPDEINKYKPYQRGAYFLGSDTTNIYARQAQLGGIGIDCGPNIRNELDDTICISYFYKTPECKELQQFYDIKYSTGEVTLLEYILTTLIKTRFCDQRASRYYLSAVISILRSLDYTKKTLSDINYISKLCSMYWLLGSNADSLFSNEISIFMIILLQCLIENKGIISKYHDKFEAILDAFKKKPIDVLTSFQNKLINQAISENSHNELMNKLLDISRKQSKLNDDLSKVDIST